MTEQRPAGVVDVVRAARLCPYSPTGEHRWLPWWTVPSGQMAYTKCSACGKQEHVSVAALEEGDG